MKEKEVLDKFGNLIIKQIRDKTLRRSINIMDGNVKAPSLKELHTKLSFLTEENKKIIEYFLKETINETIFNLLVLLEEEDIEILFEYENIKYNPNLLSDGLGGELFTEDGWIYKFSKFKSSE